MEQFFTSDYTGEPFIMFNLPHLIVIAVVILVSLIIHWQRNRFDERTKVIFRYSLTAIIMLNEISYHVWNVYYGLWSPQKHLPLWVCSMLILLIPVLLIGKSYRLYEFAYFFGFIGGTMAILTPDIGIYGYPHFRFFQIFLAHGGLIWAVVYMTSVEGFRPTLRSLKRVFIGMNIYWVIVGIINYFLGSNYIYTAGKLETPSLLDVLGPWPWYLGVMEVLALVLCLFLYLPFAIKDRRRQPAVEQI